jgi:hypothetical protein
MIDPGPDDRQEFKARRGRNVALAITLLAFVVLLFVVTIVRLKANSSPEAHGGPGAAQAAVRTLILTPTEAADARGEET